MLFPESLRLTAACAPEAPPPITTTSLVMTSDIPVVVFELFDAQRFLLGVHDAKVVVKSKAPGQKDAEGDITAWKKC